MNDLSKSTPLSELQTGLHQFNELRRKAGLGDADAQRQVKQWIEQSPEVVVHAVNPITVAREQLMQCVASATPKERAQWEQMIEIKSASILADAGDHPLSQSYAEATVLAWLEYMRSVLVPDFEGDNSSGSEFGGAAMIRAQKRWKQSDATFRKHLKQLASRKSSS